MCLTKEIQTGKRSNAKNIKKTTNICYIHLTFIDKILYTGTL